jgi:hypothetical protein
VSATRENRAELIAMAQSCLHLADQAEKNLNTVLVYETPHEYLDKAIAFEQMAAEETDAKLRAYLEQQAVAYRKLAAERAKKLKLSKPPSSQSP